MKKESLLTTAWFTLNRNCQFHCEWCYAKESTPSQIMDFEKAKSTVDALYEKGIKFDYVFLDPPYGKGLVDDILQYLVDHQMLNPQACIVVEELKEVEFKEIEGIELNKRKEYGITALNIFYYED